MDKERYVGIIMTKEEATEGVYFYFPKRIVEGYLLDETDEYSLFNEIFTGKDFLLYNDPHGGFSGEEVVGFIIKKRDLLEQDEGLSEEETKQEYFDNSKELTIVGFYLYEQEKIAFLKLGVSELYEYIKNIGLNMTNPFEFISSEKLYNMLLDANEGIGKLTLNDSENNNIEEENLEFIGLTLNDIDRLLQMDSEEIKEDLMNMKNAYNILSTSTDTTANKSSKTYSKEEVLKSADKAYENLLSKNNIGEVKMLISGLIDMYTELIVSIDDLDVESESKENAKEFFYNTVSLYETLLKTHDIDVIKQNVKKIRDRQKSHLSNISDLSDKYYYEHLRREQELNETFGNVSNEKAEKKKEEKRISFNPKEMKEFFDKKIIGQEDAKIDVISAVYMNSLKDDPINKTSCLLIGPTGSGKTLLCETVAEFLDLPFVSIDTTQLTSPGYVGGNIEDFLSRLLTSANNDLERAQRGVVLLDEIDKKGTENLGDVAGRDVLNNLLPFIQGTKYTLSGGVGLKKSVVFDTSRLTIFATGAFTDVNKYMRNGSIGFGAELSENDKEDITYKKITREDLKKHGNMPDELLGRFSTITQLSGHTKESLKTILTDSNISNLQSEKEKLKEAGIDLSWTEGYLDEVATYALSLKTGARSLKSAVESSIRLARWEAINNLDEISGIILNEDSVNDSLKTILVYKDGGNNTLEEIYSNKEHVKTRQKSDDK